METEKGDIVEEITSLKYTKIESTIADYILNHIDTVGFVPLLELAERIGVSDTSVIRFVRKLGFTGYAEFRNAMNSRLSKQYLQPSPLLPGERFAQTRDQLKETTLCRDVASLVLDNIEQTMKAMDEAVIAQIADILTHSKRKYVVGFRSTVSVASYLSRRLTLLLPDVKEIFTADSYALQSLVDSGKRIV